MFSSKQRGTVIAEGLKIVGSVTAEGLVELNGQVEGEIHCTSLIVSRQAQVIGTISSRKSSRGWVGRGSDPRWPSHSEVPSSRRG